MSDMDFRRWRMTHCEPVCAASIWSGPNPIKRMRVTLEVDADVFEERDLQTLLEFVNAPLSSPVRVSGLPPLAAGAVLLVDSPTEKITLKARGDETDGFEIIDRHPHERGA